MTKNEKLMWAVGAAVAIGFVFTVTRHGRKPKVSDQPVATSVAEKAAGGGNVGKSGVSPSRAKGVTDAQMVEAYDREAKQKAMMDRLSVVGVAKRKEFNANVSKGKQQRINEILAKLGTVDPKSKEALIYHSQLKAEMSDAKTRKGLDAWGQYMQEVRRESDGLVGPRPPTPKAKKK